MQTVKKEHFAITTFKQARRIVITVIGFTVILLGMAMLLLPGPGVLTIAFGVAILGTEFVWAKSLYRRFEKHATDVKNSIFNNRGKT